MGTHNVVSIFSDFQDQKNRSSSHRRRVPASKPLDNETMQGNVQHQCKNTCSWPQLPESSPKSSPVVWKDVPWKKSTNKPCSQVHFWYGLVTFQKNKSNLPNPSLPSPYDTALAEFPYAATSLSQFHLGGFDSPVDPKPAASDFDTKARRKKDPNRLSCSRNAFWGVAQSCWSQFLGRGYLVSMKEKSVRDIRKMIRPNPAACTAISLWELTFCSGEKGGEFTVAPPPKKNPKDGFNQIHRIGIVNISTRGRVIFGNAGAAVVPSLACKSTSCWPQDF